MTAFEDGPATTAPLFKPFQGDIMTTFEERFCDIETRADRTKRAAKAIEKATTKLRKAAQEGNIKDLKTANAQLRESLDSLQQVIDKVLSAWSLTDEEASKAMAENYSDELRREANKKGLNLISEDDGTLISPPSKIRLLPKELAIQLDKRKTSSIRPSKVAHILHKNQEKRSKFSPKAFLDALFKAYTIIITTPQDSRNQGTPVVTLEKIYEVFTSLPSSKRDYNEMDFAMDIYAVDSGETKETRSGAKVSFHSSTGPKFGKGFTFADRKGLSHSYYGIQFSGGQ